MNPFLEEIVGHYNVITMVSLGDMVVARVGAQPHNPMPQEIYVSHSPESSEPKWETQCLTRDPTMSFDLFRDA